MRTEQEPVVTKSDMHDQRFDHPAYGTVVMSVVSGGDKTLFGSDLGHSQRVCIRVNHASMERGLGRDWIYGRNQIVEFEMSHAQFAQFITSNGNGSGTPCTLKWTEGVEEIPAIKNVETKHEIYRREIKESAKEEVDKVTSLVNKLGEMLDSGKIGKKELKQIHWSLKCAAENLPSNLAFPVKSAEEALEKATSDAKIEVEAFVQATAQRLGLQSINQLAQLGNQNDALDEISALGQEIQPEDYK